MRKIIRIFIIILIFIFTVVVRHYSISLNKLKPSSVEKYQDEELNDNIIFFRDIETREIVGKKLEYDYTIDTVEEVFEILTSKSNTLPMGYTPSISPSTDLNSYEENDNLLTLNLSEEFYNSSNIDNAIEELYVNYYLIGYKKLAIKVNDILVTDTYISETIVTNKVYGESTLASVQNILVINEEENGILIPEIHVINSNVTIMDYLYEQYKGYINMMDMIDDKISIETFNEDDNYLISLVINSNFSYEYGIILSK